MKQIRQRLTYANVMSSIAVFLVLGGATALAAGQLGKNTVGSKQLKKDAVTAAKIKNGAVTGAKIKTSTLGVVPKASLAETATTATNATNAANATNAGNAAKLGGTPASGYAKSQLPTPTLATLAGTWKTEPGRLPASFYKDPFGIVHFEGVVEGGTDFSQIFTLPEGFRPEGDANFLIYGSASTPAGIIVSTAGVVTMLEGDESFISLYGVTFRAGN